MSPRRHLAVPPRCPSDIPLRGGHPPVPLLGVPPSHPLLCTLLREGPHGLGTLGSPLPRHPPAARTQQLSPWDRCCQRAGRARV